MDAARLTHGESACARGKHCITLAMMIALPMIAIACGGGAPAAASTAATPTPTPTPTPAPGPPTPLSGATITILSTGFVLDATSAKSYPLSDLHVYQGSQLLFVNADTETHDVLSDPFGAHNDCPEINTAGFLVPSQSRATSPLTVLRSCGFHDHSNEGNAAFGGKVTIEPR
jgi:hypothetical protein